MHYNWVGVTSPNRHSDLLDTTLKLCFQPTYYTVLVPWSNSVRWQFKISSNDFKCVTDEKQINNDFNPPMFVLWNTFCFTFYVI